MKEKVNDKILLKGFVHNIRVHIKVIFILLRDKSGIAQTVTSDDKPFFEDISKVKQETVIGLIGVVSKDERSKQGVELQVTSYEIIAKAKQQLR